MSWSMTAIGAAANVKQKVQTDLLAITCAEPEQSVKGLIGDLLHCTLETWPADAGVKVEASGSQSVAGSGENQRVMNTFKVEVTSIYGLAPPVKS